MPSNSLRVLYCIYTLDGGGAERELRCLLDGHTDQVKLAVCFADPAGSEKIDSNKVDLFHIPRRHRLDLRWKPITKLIKEWQPDIVVNWLPYVISNTLIPARIARVPLFISVLQNTHWLNSYREIQWWLYHWQADAIAANAHPDEQGRAYQPLLRHKPFKWIPNGSDIEEIVAAEPIDLTQFGLNPDLPTLLFASRLEPVKNPFFLVRMMQMLEQIGCDTQLLICCDGSLRNKLESAISNANLTDCIHLVGHQEDIFGIMKACDIFIHPSTREGMPNSLIEAMAAGLPVIVSSIPVHLRWITHEENGLIADIDEPDPFCEHIQRFLTDSIIREQCIKAGQQLTAQLTPQRYATLYENWYDSLQPLK